VSDPDPDLRRAQIRLAPGRDRPLRDGHPWIYSGAIAEERHDGRAEGPPALAEVTDAAGRALGVGFYSPRSQLRVRLLEGRPKSVDRDFFRRRIDEARALRQVVVGANSSGYRLLNAEGDGLPGWTVDRFGDVLVSQITVAGLDALRGEAYQALAGEFPAQAILHLGNLAARRLEGLDLVNEWVRGEARAEAPFEEEGLKLVAELAGGQKTGFYCDQRENRRLAGRLAAGRSLLDLFAHSGGFALHALRAGASRAVLVESAARLLALARRQIAGNALPAERAELVEADVFRDLREREERFGVVVCDPPPLARRRADLDRAARAYKDLNRLALGRVEPGGFLLTFSCSGAVDSKLFRQILFSAAVEARVRVRMLAPLAAAPDHPVSIFHPEGEYLKGWLLAVVGSSD
jgi:23S rRNA (cytosine1962-C5)-methyltransferase